LSIIAQNFEQYKLRGVIFEFKSTSADALNSTNTALGEVIMATEYDSKKQDFASKLEMQNHEYAVAAKQSQSMLHPIECAHPLSTLDCLYLRTGQVPVGADQRMYDFGKFQIATMGQQGSNVDVGELWVTYEVEFLKPRLQGEGNIVYTSVYEQDDGCSNTDYFGREANPDTLLSHPLNTLSMKITQTGLEFPNDIGNGTFVLSIYWFGTTVEGVSSPTLTPEPSSGIMSDNSSVPFVQMNSPSGEIGMVSVQYMVYLGTVVIPGTPRRVNFTGGALPTNCGCNITITSINTGLARNDFNVPYVDPVEQVVMRLPSRFGRNFREVQSEKQLVKQEIKRLQGLLQDEDLEESAKNEVKKHLHNSEAEESDDEASKDGWEDMTKSTADSIQAIVAKAKAKKSLLEKQITK
jgi:hypothetical protein